MEKSAVVADAAYYFQIWDGNKVDILFVGDAVFDDRRAGWNRQLIFSGICRDTVYYRRMRGFKIERVVGVELPGNIVYEDGSGQKYYQHQKWSGAVTVGTA